MSIIKDYLTNYDKISKAIFDVSVGGWGIPTEEEIEKLAKELKEEFPENMI